MLNAIKGIRLLQVSNPLHRKISNKELRGIESSLRITDINSCVSCRLFLQEGVKLSLYRLGQASRAPGV